MLEWSDAAVEDSLRLAASHAIGGLCDGHCHDDRSVQRTDDDEQPRHTHPTPCRKGLCMWPGVQPSQETGEDCSVPTPAESEFLVF